jgi:hypothetical protein
VKEYDVPHGVSEYGTCISMKPDRLSSAGLVISLTGGASTVTVLSS